MNVLIATFILLILFSSANSDNFNYPLIKDYLEWNNINVNLFVSCGQLDWKEIKDNLLINDIYFNHWDMSHEADVLNFNYQHFLVRTTYPICVTVDWECNTTSNMLHEISKRIMFHQERHWLIFGRSAEEMFATLSKEYINVDAEVVVVSETETESYYELSEVYNPSVKRSGIAKMERIGGWNETARLNMIERTKLERRRNLNGVKFIAGITIPKLPQNKTLLEHIDSDEYLFMDNMSKSNYRVFQVLMEMYNFSMVLRRVKLWGFIQDGSWHGVVGLLNRSEIDISISGLRWEHDRYGAFDQTANSFYCDIIFIFRHPKSVDAWNVFLSPFVGVVWLLIFSTAIATSLLIRTFFSFENRLSAKSNILQTTTNDDTYYNSFLIIFGILFQQGCSDNPSFVSSRIFTLTYLLFSVVIYQFYGSYIVGSLLTETPKTIKTMKQLLNSELDVAMDELPYVHDTFTYAREESALKMYNRIMAQTTPFQPLFTGLNSVKEGTLAFNTDGIYAYAVLKSILTVDEICDLQEIKYVQKIPTGPGLQKKSPLRELVKIGIRTLHEAGVIKYVWKTWISDMPKCERSEVEVVPLDMVHFSSALYVFGIGFQISLLLFIGELCLARFVNLCKN